MSARRVLTWILLLTLVPISFGVAGADSVDPVESRLQWALAVEEVRWEARHWPRDNPGPKPRFEDVVDVSALRARVVEQGRAEAALRRYWSVEVAPEAIQAELERMARDTRAPRVLQRMFEALGSDGFAAAESLARPVVVERRARSRYARDDRMHAAVRQRAETTLDALRRGESVRAVVADDTYDIAVPAAGAPQGPPGTVGPLRETDTRFHAEVVRKRTGDVVEVTRLTWRKMPFRAWLASVADELDVSYAMPGTHHDLPEVDHVEATCDTDSWFKFGGPPAARNGHLAVFTGTEMIVWGGEGQDDGRRYDLATDTWNRMAFAGAPPAGVWPGVWTGTAMLVAAGSQSAAYDPVADAWTPLSAGAPVISSAGTAVWTGSRMIVWGGFPYSGSGAVYDPSSDTWAPMRTRDAPAPRAWHTAVWTGDEMIVWGGRDESNRFADGAAYDPQRDRWSPISAVGAPEGRYHHTAVWTGSEMIVWGGQTASLFRVNSGGRYDPASDSWTPTSQPIGLSTRREHAAVWTGSEMIVWCGSSTTGSKVRYDPVGDTWGDISGVDAPATGEGCSGVWTGSEMIVWGGGTTEGGRYDPVADSWTPTEPDLSPSRRVHGTATWTGAEVVVWGGEDDDVQGDELDTGGVYDLALDAWVPTTMVGAPQSRKWHTAVWTGREVVIWGGQRFETTDLNTGARYDPLLDAWTATSVDLAARRLHTAVWTGEEMLVWGGELGNNGYLGNGKGYDPTTDTWAPITTVDAAAPRSQHSAVWTGDRMIVYGGEGGSATTSGSRYTRSTDSWAQTRGGPQAFGNHRAAWSGEVMMLANGLWGIELYDPDTNLWTPTSPVDAWESSNLALAWTGDRFVLWSGSNDERGGRLYDPVTDVWTPTTEINAPQARTEPLSAWTGTRLFVFGGLPQASSDPPLGSGGLYCTGCETTYVYYRDRDGDGFGDETDTVESCSAAPSTGYSDAIGDCDEGDGAVWAVPGEVGGLRFDDAVTLAWDEPAEPGAESSALGYDVLRSDVPEDFVGAICLVVDAAGRTAEDLDLPDPGAVFHYLSAAVNTCGRGTLGTDSGGTTRGGPVCP